jgi:hypothetical protein
MSEYVLELRNAIKKASLLLRDIGDEASRKPRVLAWKTVPREQRAMLEYFMADYVGHFKHHLNQVVKLD